MEKQTHQTPLHEETANLDALFLEMFTPEFLASLPPEHIETVIHHLEQVESASETTPPEWLALKNVLQERGLLEESSGDNTALNRPA